ncbi:oligopeptide/dipeptide ABC transporter ATP-binding protein [Mesorhizobium sp. M0217]|uniref:ABC transporter ATP-binding protein n=1 Tax=unclassified Mesorhizobium TaxID=325217 RepID=UPI003337D226
MTVPILQVLGLKKYYPLSSSLFWRTKSFVHAVDDVSFDLHRGETLSLVGESGCGKSTVGRSILGLSSLTAGQIFLDGTRIDAFSQSAWRPLRRRMQFVFQDPFSSLNPRMRVRDILAEPLRNFSLATNGSEIDAKVGKLLATVSLPKDAGSRWPHEFSGGQRQRIGIARALATNPDVIVCDEAVSALDVSVKAQIINLLQDLQAELGVALLFISHDLAVVEHLTHRVAVMYLGKIVELGSKRDVFAAPRHPYTEALMSAVPVPKVGDQRRRIVLNGDIPSPINPPTGCYFHTRCPHAFDRCVRVEPELKEVTPGRFAACHLNDEPLVAGASL